MRTYGIQLVEITDQGIFISKFPRYKMYSPWESVLDITVKKSESIFSTFNSNLNKITIYTMDKAISLETMTLTNHLELSSRLKAFGDSLEERVIDFGYGATLSIVWRRIKRSKVGVMGTILVIFFILISLFASAITLVVPHTTLEAQLRERTLFNLWNPVYGAGDPDSYNQPPSNVHWFGTNANGQDIFSRLLFGAFYSILIGVIATFISTILGFFIGAASGYIGGTTDQIVQRVTEVINSMPSLPLLLLISGIFYQVFPDTEIEGAYYLTVYTIFAFIAWAGTARIIRAEVLSLKNSEFILAERVLGASHWRIITKHIMPNAMSTAIIFFTLGIAGTISGVAVLAYLGFGTGNTLVWGQDLASASQNSPTQYWWGITFISLALFLLVLGFNLFGDALRDALDPKLKN
jgi:ABC-type dipeptide/oligopeptide/nickel transport system permease subunit